MTDLRLGGVFGDRELAWLRQLVNERLTDWDQAVRSAAVPLSRTVACGSLHTGLLEGTKPARYSNSPTPPPRPTIVELDTRLILKAGADISRPRLLALIGESTGTKLAQFDVINRWETQIPMATFYAHQILDERTAIEWEVCVNVEPYFETTPYWADVFSRSEITAQRQARSRYVRQGATRSDYEMLKSRQGQEFRWRLSSGIAHLPLALLPPSLRHLATETGRYPYVRAFIRRAQEGQLARPGLRNNRDQPPSLEPHERPPSAPNWVTLLPGFE
jgi:hypothetical protein